MYICSVLLYRSMVCTVVLLPHWWCAFSRVIGACAREGGVKTKPCASRDLTRLALFYYAKKYKNNYTKKNKKHQQQQTTDNQKCTKCALWRADLPHYHQHSASKSPFLYRYFLVLPVRWPQRRCTRALGANSRGTGSNFGINRFLIPDCLRSMCTVKMSSFTCILYSAPLSAPVLDRPTLDCRSFFYETPVICLNGPPETGSALSLEI